MKYEIKAVSLGSLVFSALPVVVFMAALIGGIASFMIIPGGPKLELWQKFLAAGFYALLYCVLATALAVFLAFLYNLLTGALSMPGIKLVVDEDSAEEAG